jgi:DNA-binding MarR family transcriptional regulator
MNKLSSHQGKIKAVSATKPSEIALALHRFGLQRDRLRTALARATGLAPADLDALEHLEADGPLTQRQLGDRLLLTSGAVTMLVDRLERAGLVARRRHPGDRRAVLVQLGARSTTAQPAALTDYHAAIGAAVHTIGAEHRDAIAAFLTQVADEAARATTALKAAS